MNSLTWDVVFNCNVRWRIRSAWPNDTCEASSLIDGTNAGLMLKMLAMGETPAAEYRAPLALWQFGADLTLVGISGEVVSDYIRHVERELGADRLWVSGYSNQVFGYLPSRRIVKEGGYEARGLVASGVGWFAPEAEDVLLRELHGMAERAGRKLPH